MSAAPAPVRNGLSSFSQSISFVDSKLQEARQRMAFPLPNLFLIFHADCFYNLRGDPTCKLQLSEAIKYQLLFAANAHKDARGITHLGENFTIQFLNVHDLVLLYRILNSYLSQERFQNTGRGVFHRHVYEIEKRLEQLCLSGPVKKEEVLAELKGWKDSSLEPLIFNISSDDQVFLQLKKTLTQWCEDKSGTPEYLDRMISFAKLEEAYQKRSSSSEALDSVRQELAAAKAELVAKEKILQFSMGVSESQPRLMQAKVAENQTVQKELESTRFELARKERALQAVLSSNEGLVASISDLEKEGHELNAALVQAGEYYSKNQQQIRQLQAKIAQLTDTHAKEKAEFQQQIGQLQSRISLMNVAPGQKDAIDNILASQARAEALIEGLLKEVANLDIKTEAELSQKMEILVQRMGRANGEFVPSLNEKNDALRRVQSLRGKSDKVIEELRRGHEAELKKHEAEILVHTSRHESMSAILQGMTSELSSTQDHVKVLQEQIRKMGAVPAEMKKK